MSLLLIPLSSFTPIVIHAFSIYIKVVFWAKLYRWNRWHSWHGSSGHIWASAFLPGWMLLARWVALMHTRNINSNSESSQSYTVYTCYFDFVRTSEVNDKFYCYWLLRFITNIWSRQDKNLLLSLYIFYSSSHKPFLLVASRLFDTWLTLIYTFLIYPKIGRLPICRHLRFLRLTRAWIFISNILDRRQNSYCCHCDSCIRPHTNLSSWSLVSWFILDLLTTLHIPYLLRK